MKFSHNCSEIFRLFDFCPVLSMRPYLRAKFEIGLFALRFSCRLAIISWTNVRFLNSIVGFIIVLVGVFIIRRA
jgi:hypothetical protein